jgi:hypothetical protein
MMLLMPRLVVFDQTELPPLRNDMGYVCPYFTHSHGAA